MITCKCNMRWMQYESPNPASGHNWVERDVNLEYTCASKDSLKLSYKSNRVGQKSIQMINIFLNSVLLRNVLLVQLDGCAANYLLGKDRIIISVTQEVVGCHWRHAENLFLWPQSSDLYFTVWGEFTCRATSGASCVCTTYPPPPPQLTPTIGAMRVEFPCC